jgi:hypothetical protein
VPEPLLLEETGLNAVSKGKEKKRKKVNRPDPSGIIREKIIEPGLTRKVSQEKRKSELEIN